MTVGQSPDTQQGNISLDNRSCAAATHRLHIEAATVWAESPTGRLHEG